MESWSVGEEEKGGFSLFGMYVYVCGRGGKG